MSITIHSATPFSEEAEFLHIVRNVASYDHSQPPSIHIQTLQPAKEEDPPARFFALDCGENAAFGHWVYEALIYLPLYLDLKKKHPTIRLISKNPRKYKQLFFELFAVPAESVLHELPRAETPNIVYFHPVINLGAHGLNPTVFDIHLERFISVVDSIVAKRNPTRIPLLYMPRQTAENYPYNDRVVVNNDDIYQSLIPFNVRRLNTDSVTKMEDQIAEVASAETLIVTYGSPLLVNGLFARNAHIICLAEMNNQAAFPLMMHIVTKIKSLNKTLRFLPNIGSGTQQAFSLPQIVSCVQEAKSD